MGFDLLLLFFIGGLAGWKSQAENQPEKVPQDIDFVGNSDLPPVDYMAMGYLINEEMHNDGGDGFI